MMEFALRLVQWACDPAKVEVLEGDLLELYARGRPVLGEAVSACLLHSRFVTPNARRRALRIGAVAAAAAVIALGTDPAGARAAPRTYRINANDPVGSFTLEFRNSRVVQATIDDVPVDPERLVQQGRRLVIKGGDRGRDFHVAIKPSGGIAWTARIP